MMLKITAAMSIAEPAGILIRPGEDPRPSECAGGGGMGATAETQHLQVIYCRQETPNLAPTGSVAWESCPCCPPSFFGLPSHFFCPKDPFFICLIPNIIAFCFFPVLSLVLTHFLNFYSTFLSLLCCFFPTLTNKENLKT